MDFDVSSGEGEVQLQEYMQVQQVPNDTDPLMWWMSPTVHITQELKYSLGSGDLLTPVSHKQLGRLPKVSLKQ